MAKKQFCDYCGEEIDFELSDEVYIYNHASENKEFKKDICESCKKKVLSKLKEIKNGKYNKRICKN